MNSESAYKKALDFAKTHYENFPVVSFLIKKGLQKDVAIIYWFARTADDLADEGNFTAAERLSGLNEFENRLSALLKGEIENEYELALAETIVNRGLSSEHFYNLLKAFKQDVIKNRYSTFFELEEYCSNSANPVGRLILELHDIRNAKAFEYSDKICTALQLTNFYQDVNIDLKKNRIYFPQDEMQKFGVDENAFLNNGNNINLLKLVEFNIKRTKELYSNGKNLLSFLNGALKYEIKWTIAGGEAILSKIEKNDFDLFNERPKLNKKDFIILLLKSIFK